MQDYNAAYLSKCMKLPRLTKEEEREAFSRYKNGSQSAFDLLVMHHVPLVHHVALKFKKWNVSYEDLMSVGIIGLIIAINKFDPDKGFQISTLAGWHIRVRLQKYVTINAISQMRIDTNIENRRMFSSLRYIKAKFGFYDKMNYQQCKIVADHFGGVSPEQVHEMDMRLRGELSLDKPFFLDDDTCITLADMIVGDNGLDIDDRLDKARYFDMVRKASCVLDEHEKLIINWFFYDDDEDNTQKQIAQDLNVSVTMLKKYKQRAFGKMRKFLQDNGFEKYLLV